MIYTIYNTISGRISRTVDTDTGISLQLGRDENYLAGSYSGNFNYIDSSGQVVAMPQKPGEYYEFDYTTKQWEAQQGKALAYAQIKRQSLLTSSDWTQLPNGPLTTQQQSEWATYRQQLRDITTQPGYPLNITWPVAPQ